MAQEPIYLMEKDDGTLVRVPASKLESFDPHDTKVTEEDYRMAERLVQAFRRKYGQA